MKEEISRCTFEIDQDLYNAFKIYCIQNKICIKDILTDFIKETIKKE